MFVLISSSLLNVILAFDERQEEQRSAVITRRIFDADGPSTSTQEPSTSVERLKRNLKQDRDRKINEQVIFFLT